VVGELAGELADDVTEAALGHPMVGDGLVHGGQQRIDQAVLVSMASIVDMAAALLASRWRSGGHRLASSAR
jgi:hypothetical protein